MVKVLKVEPGSQVSVTARFLSTSPVRGAFGLKVGQVASAKISPVAGSSAIAIPDRAWEPVTARESARSVGELEPLVDGQLHTGTLARPAGVRRVAQHRPPRAVAERRDAGRLAAEHLVELPLEPFEAVAVVADEAEEVGGERALGVVALALGDERHPGDLELPDRGGLGGRDAPLEPREARLLPDPTGDRPDVDAERSGQLLHGGRGGALEGLGVHEDRLGVGAHGERHAGPIRDHATPRLQDELAEVLVARLGGEPVLLHHLELHGSREHRGEAEREQDGDGGESEGDPPRGAVVEPGAHSAHLVASAGH